MKATDEGRVMMNGYPSELLACAAILIAVMIFRDLSRTVRSAVSFSASGAGVLAAIAAYVNGAVIFS
jgi:hypothetical protein